MGPGLTASGIPSEFGDALIAFDVLALAVFFGLFHAKRIGAAVARVRSLLSPSALLARRRARRAALKTPLSPAP